MNTSALLMLIVSEVIIAGFTCYFFWLALKVPPRAEPDSYSDNDIV